MENPFRRRKPEVPISELDDAALQQQLDEAQAAGERVDARLNRLDDRLDRIDSADEQRAKSVHETADTLGARTVTDPSSREPTTRPGESVTASLTVVPLIGRLARRYSVYESNNETANPVVNEDGEATPAPSPEFDVAKGGLLSVIRDALSEKRQYKQKRRQDRSKRVEKVYGTRIGRGKQAAIGTKLNRFGIWKDSTQRYLNGEITASERGRMIRNWDPHTSEERESLEQELAQRRQEGRMAEAQQLADLLQVSHGRKYTTTGAVRREVRKERAGALYNLARAEQPIAKQVRKASRDHAEEQIERSEERLDELDAQARALRIEQLDRQQAAIEAERARLRGEEPPEDDGPDDGGTGGAPSTPPTP